MPGASRSKGVASVAYTLPLPSLPVDATFNAFYRTVSYLGVLQQALRDLSAWVEKGVPPPQTTHYQVVDGQVVVPDAAAARGGIQIPDAIRKDSERRKTRLGVGSSVHFCSDSD
jgi:hypothetical protein